MFSSSRLQALLLVEHGVQQAVAPGSRRAGRARLSSVRAAPRMPVRGVRNSWLTVAMRSVRMRSVACRRSRTLPWPSQRACARASPPSRACSLARQNSTRTSASASTNPACTTAVHSALCPPSVSACGATAPTTACCTATNPIATAKHPPVLVERDERHGDEVVEVQLGASVEQVDEDGGAGQQPHGGRERGHPSGHRSQGQPEQDADAAALHQAVRDAAALQPARGRTAPAGAPRARRQTDPVPPGEVGLGERPAGGQPGADAGSVRAAGGHPSRVRRLVREANGPFGAISDAVLPNGTFGSAHPAASGARAATPVRVTSRTSARGPVLSRGAEDHRRSRACATTPKRGTAVLPAAVPSALPVKQGLYDPAHEHDACGVAFVADIAGRASHDIVDQGLTALRNMEHRGASGSRAGLRRRRRHPRAAPRRVPARGRPGRAPARRAPTPSAPPSCPPARGPRSTPSSPSSASPPRRACGSCAGATCRSTRRAPASGPRPARSCRCSARCSWRRPPRSPLTPEALERRAYVTRKRVEHESGDLLPVAVHPHPGLQGDAHHRPARGLLPGPARRALRQRAGPRAQPLLHQHLPELAAGPPVPLHRAQRRDQHRSGQPQLDACPGGPAARPGRAARRPVAPVPGLHARRVATRPPSTRCSSCCTWAAARCRTPC